MTENKNYTNLPPQQEEDEMEIDLMANPATLINNLRAAHNLRAYSIKIGRASCRERVSNPV